jgi:hypothetical protein
MRFVACNPTLTHLLVAVLEWRNKASNTTPDGTLEIGPQKTTAQLFRLC